MSRDRKSIHLHSEIMRIIATLAPTVDTYRSIALQVYPQLPATNLAANIFSVRRSFRRLVTSALGNGKVVYYYELPTGRCDGVHVCPQGFSPLCRNAQTCVYYCYEGIPHGIFMYKLYDDVSRYVTVVRGLFDGPAWLQNSKGLMRESTYLNGYLSGEFVRDSGRTMSTAVYATVYGPRAEPSYHGYECQHRSMEPYIVHQEYTIHHKNVVCTTLRTIKNTFIGGILHGTVVYDTESGSVVKCKFANGLLDGVLTVRDCHSGHIGYSQMFKNGMSVIPTDD